MSVQGPIPVEFGTVFPAGAYAAGAFDPVRNFDASTGEKFVQSHDKATGAPLWVIEVIDPDPAARTRAVKVKVAAPVQPVVPSGPPGSPFVPVEFTGMTVTPYVNQAGRLAYSLKATGIRAPVGLAWYPGASDLFVTMNQRDDLGDATPGDWLAVVVPGQDWQFPDCYGQGGSACDGAPSPVAVLDKHAAVSGVAICQQHTPGWKKFLLRQRRFSGSMFFKPGRKPK